MDFEAPFALAVCTDKDLQSLCECLWQRRVCNACEAGHRTSTHDASCDWLLYASRIETFFQYYRAVTSLYLPELLPGSSPALNSHGDLHKLIKGLKQHIKTTRSEFTKTYFMRCKNDNAAPPPLSDQSRAVDLAVRVMMMVNCAVDEYSLGLLESGVAPLTWHNDETLVQFFEKIFPQSTHRALDTKSDFGRAPGIAAMLAAPKLKSIAKLKLEPTNDIRDHLRLDQSKGILLVYHHVGFLIACLSASRNSWTNRSLEHEIERYVIIAVGSLRLG
jgi:hypothetical protein